MPKTTTKAATPKMVVATAKTLAGQYRQVAEGRAQKTKGGLTKDDIVRRADGRYVSKAKSERMKALSAGGKSPNAFWTAMTEAKKNNLDEFQYTNTKGETFLYRKHTTKTGLQTFKRAE